MRAGRATKSFYVTELTKIQGDYGKYQKVHRRVTSQLRGDIQILSIRERINAGNMDNREVIAVRTYVNTQVKHERFIEWNDTQYNIVAIEPNWNGREVVITAEREI